jgi:hypothetical protein
MAGAVVSLRAGHPSPMLSLNRDNASFTLGRTANSVLSSPAVRSIIAISAAIAEEAADQAEHEAEKEGVGQSANDRKAAAKGDPEGDEARHDDQRGNGCAAPSLPSPTTEASSGTAL